jgi:selenocysteine lyase/cysteine desulfurase
MASAQGVGRRELFRKAAIATAAAAIVPGTALAEGAHAARGHRGADELQAPPTLTAPRGTERLWRQVRKAFALPEDYIHMNTGTTGSPPSFVLDNLGVYGAYKALDPRDWEKNLNADFPDLVPLASSLMGPSAMAARQAWVAAAYDANPDEIVLSYDTTDACNLIFAGTPWNPGDRIVTTSMEHPALDGPMAWARDHHGVQLVVIDIPSRFDAGTSVEEVVSWFEEALDRPLQVAGAKQYVAFSEVFYKNGLRMPVPEICAAARARGAFSIVDTAHGWGQLPIDCHGYGADFIAGAGHKWLCGGPGTGICYVRNSGTAPLAPFAMGNFFLYGSPFEAPSAFYQNRSWAPGTYMQLRGESNTPALYAMTDSLSFFTAIGLQDIYQRGTSLASALRRRILERWGPRALWVADHPDVRFRTALTSFNPFAGNENPAQFATLNSAINAILAALAAETPKIYVRSTTWRDRHSDPADNRVGFRVATHAVYNDLAQIDWFVDRLAEQVAASGLPQLHA